MVNVRDNNCSSPTVRVLVVTETSFQRSCDVNDPYQLPLSLWIPETMWEGPPSHCCGRLETISWGPVEQTRGRGSVVLVSIALMIDEMERERFGNVVKKSLLFLTSTQEVWSDKSRDDIRLPSTVAALHSSQRSRAQTGNDGDKKRWPTPFSPPSHQQPWNPGNNHS